MKHRAPWTLLLSLASLTACVDADQRTDSLDARAGESVREQLDPGVVAQLDSGNVAYRVRDLDRAALHYRRVTEMAPDLAAGWFGLFMTETMRGNEATADSAFEKARELAPGASLLRPNEHGNQP